MSAGSGVTHSEFNHSGDDSVHFLQIWIVPAENGTEPGYQQVSVPEADKRGQFRLIVSPKGDAGSLTVRQDMKIYAGFFDGAEQATVNLDPNRYAYIHVARGSIKVNGIEFRTGDGARVRQSASKRTIHALAGRSAGSSRPARMRLAPVSTVGSAAHGVRCSGAPEGKTGVTR